jgi:DNA ligase (NAD+)
MISTLSEAKQFIDKYNESQIASFLLKCDQAYHSTGSTLVNDDIYDYIKDNFAERYPDNPYLKNIGEHESIKSTDRVKLPYHMGSMNKVKESPQITKFIKKYPGSYVVTPKLDGTSAIIHYNAGKRQMFSRGDGDYGRDISYLLKYMNVPKSFPPDIVVRGEIIISREDYEKVKDKYANPRGFVNGLTTKKEMPVSSDVTIQFVVFDLIKPQIIPSQMFNHVRKLGFTVPKFEIINSEQFSSGLNDIRKSFIFNKLEEYKKTVPYEIDGLVITHDEIYPPTLSGNPKHAVAFKANNLGKITHITNIEYNISKHGVLIPRIQFEEVNLSGSKVKFCSGVNARNIIEQKLNVGAVIRVVLSGEIIPYIVEVIEPASEPAMPSIPYKFSASGIDVVPLDTSGLESKEYNVKRITHFFKTLEVDNLGEGIVTRLYDAKYTSINQFLEITVDDLLKIEGFKQTLAEKIYNNIQGAITGGVKMVPLMLSSLAFGKGFGARKLKKIVELYNSPKKIATITVDKLIEIEGFSDKTAEAFVSNIPAFQKFLEEHPLLKPRIIKKIIRKKTPGSAKHSQSKPDLKFKGQVFVLSGTRDAKAIEYIEKNGGVIGDTINKKTTTLIVKSLEKKTGKISKAEALGINIVTVGEFIG